MNFIEYNLYSASNISTKTVTTYEKCWARKHNGINAAILLSLLLCCSVTLEVRYLFRISPYSAAVMNEVKLGIWMAADAGAANELHGRA